MFKKKKKKTVQIVGVVQLEPSFQTHVMLFTALVRGAIFLQARCQFLSQWSDLLRWTGSGLSRTITRPEGEKSSKTRTQQKMILPGNRYITVCLVFLSTDARQFVSIKHAIGSCSPPYSSRSGHTGLGRCQCNVPCYVMWWLRLLYQRSASVKNNTGLVWLWV